MTMRYLLVSVACVLAMATFASAQGTVNAGLQVLDTEIEALPGQEVIIMATGTASVSGVSLQVQVGDGGDPVGGTDVAGTDAAPITGVNFRQNSMGPSMWGDAAAAAELPNLGSDAGAPLLAFPVFVLAGAGAVRPAPGAVAALELDGSGLPIGTSFQIHLEIPAAGVRSNFNGPDANELISGTITVIPEPVSALMLLAAAPFLRRRRA